jgi:hypothetical protein
VHLDATMTMTASFQKQPDQARIVAFLADETHLPVADVARLYEHERDALASRARVTTFLQIFVVRAVRDVLRERSEVARRGAVAAGSLVTA